MKAEPIVFSGSASMEYLSDLCCGVHCWFFNPLFISALVIYIYIDVNFYFYADNSKIHMSSKSLVENVFFLAKESIKELPVRPVRQSKNGNRRQMPNDRFFPSPYPTSKSSLANAWSMFMKLIVRKNIVNRSSKLNVHEKPNCCRQKIMENKGNIENIWRPNIEANCANKTCLTRTKPYKE